MKCLIELQDFEREIDPRMPAGKDIAAEYVDHLFQRCIDCDGQILIAEKDNEIAGYTSVFAKVVSEEIDDGKLEYGLISDIVVMQKFRGSGIGGDLMDAAESYARKRKVKWLRIGVMARNELATNMYRSRGFEELYIELEKNLTWIQTVTEKYGYKIAKAYIAL